MKTIYYYNSTVGTIRYVCDDKFLLEISFVKKIGQNPKSFSKIGATCKRELDEYFAGKLKKFTVPFEIKSGTIFQRKVWKALRDIPYAQTKSYKEIAIDIGAPKAARAVGGANNKNPISIIIPCHRVIGSSGKLVGYASGLEIKKRLIEIEAKNE